MNVKSKIEDHFFSNRSAVTMAVFRILFGIFCLIWTFTLLLQSEKWLLRNSVLSPEIMRQWLCGSSFPCAAEPYALLPPSTPDVVYFVVLFLCLVFSGFLTVGWMTRLSIVGVFVGFQILQSRAFLVMYGGDFLIFWILIYLFFSGSEKALSLDARGPALTSLAGRRLIQMQFAIIYLSTSLWKLQMPDWHNGAALYYVFHSVTYAKIPDWVQFRIPGLYAALSWSTMALEGALGLLFLFPRLWWAAIPLSILLHLSIEFTMTITLWHWPMILCALTLVPNYRWLRWYLHLRAQWQEGSHLVRRHLSNVSRASVR